MTKRDRRADPPASQRGATAPGAEEPPPLLGSWRALYTLLLVELTVLIVLFTLLGRWASS